MCNATAFCVCPVEGGCSAGKGADWEEWESKKGDLVIFGFGSTTVFDTCVPDLVGGEPLTAEDTDFESGVGGALLQAGPPAIDPATGLPCSPTPPHHSTTFYVRDLVYDQFFTLRDVVSGTYGWDGTAVDPVTGMPTPCGDGIFSDGVSDCLETFWGKGPHGPCTNGARTFGLDGRYWVFIDTATVDLNAPRVGTTTLGCIWTNDYAGKVPPPLKVNCITKV